MIVIPILNQTVIADEGVMAHVHELGKNEYEGRLIGTYGNEKASGYIVNQLENYNIEPLFDGSYISEFQVEPSLNIIEASEFTVRNISTGEKLDEYKYKIDYYFETWASSTLETLQGEILTVEEFLQDEFDKTKEYFLVLNYEGNQAFQSKISNQIISSSHEYKFIKGIIVPDHKQPIFLNKKIQINEKGLTKILDEIETFENGIPPITINVGRSTGKKLWDLSGNIMTVNTTIKNPKDLKGHNIGGIIKGKSDDHPIIIATTYDFLGQHDFSVNTSSEDIVVYNGIYENITSIAGSLELARNLGERNQTPERSIIFIFIFIQLFPCTNISNCKLRCFYNV